jgi:hypothetical protein
VKHQAPEGALLVDYRAAAGLLGGISIMTLHRMIEAGELVRVKLGRRAFVTRESVGALVARRAARG